MSTTGDYERPPDAVITVSCAVDEGSFADLDRDGVDDLVLRSGPTVFSWPSSRPAGAPLVWQFQGTGEPGWVDISTPNVGPARVQWWGFLPDAAYEYEVDPDTLDLVELGSGMGWYGINHTGDVDGDGAADLLGSGVWPASPVVVRASTTGIYTELPGYGYRDYEQWPWQYVPGPGWSVGDMNHDGYDDLLVGQRDGEVLWDFEPKAESAEWGPAQLYLGTPTGISTEPLWTLFAPDWAEAGVGRGVAALPDEGVLVVTVVEEGSWHQDHSPEFLGVIRDADTPYAYFDELVEVPEFTPGGFTPYLLGWMDDGTGQRALAMSEDTGWTGIQWIPWHSDGTGFHPDADGVAVPSAWWTPPSDQILHGFDPLAFPVGRHQQAVLLGLASYTDYQLVEWGRPPEALGIPCEGVTVEGCTFTVTAWGAEAPDCPAPTVSEEPGKCGCAGSAEVSWLAGLLALVVGRWGRLGRRK